MRTTTGATMGMYSANSTATALVAALLAFGAIGAPPGARAQEQPTAGAEVFTIADGLDGPAGVAVGPEGELYVNNCRGNSVSRISPEGEVRELASDEVFKPPTATHRPVPRSSLRMVKLPSISQRMVAALRSSGIEAMEQAYREFKEAPATSGVFTEAEVNALGYQLMSSGRLEAATRVFELNVEFYPDSWNVGRVSDDDVRLKGAA